MKAFYYVNHQKEVLVYGLGRITKEPVIEFGCYAESISEADKKYLDKLGKDPTKEKYIGCVVL